jgi:AcrR family transcriptional regulator
MSDMGTAAPSRRERVRADTMREIQETARRLLVRHGPEGLALRGVAREMGMTAPALYRYFTSREDLVDHVVADLYGELCDALDAARDAAAPAPAVRLLAVSRAFRGWATSHHLEFGLLFGSPVETFGGTGHAHGPDGGPAEAAAQRFGAVFSGLLAQLYLESPFPVPPAEDLDPSLRSQLRTWCDQLPVQLPLGVTYVFVSCWIRLYGMVAMEVFGHLAFALEDAEPMFEAELRSIAALVGVAEQYSAPGA